MTIREPLGADESLRALATMLDELACEERLELLCVLAEGPMEVSGLCTRLDLAMPVVSGHLGHLIHMGLLERRTNGRWRIYALSGAARVSHSGASVELVVTFGAHMRCSFTLPRTALRRLTPAASKSDHEEPPTPHTPRALDLVIPPRGDHVPRGNAASPDRPPTGP